VPAARRNLCSGFNLVVVASFSTVNMRGNGQPVRAIEAASGNRHTFTTQLLKKQAGTTAATKTPPETWNCLEPLQGVIPHQAKVLASSRRRRNKMATGAPALLAVTRYNLPQGSVDFVDNTTASASTSCFAGHG